MSGMFTRMCTFGCTVSKKLCTVAQDLSIHYGRIILSSCFANPATVPGSRYSA